MNPLVAHIEAQNAESAAWAAEEEGRWAGETVTDPEFWAECGVYTVEDYEKYQLACSISESAKTAYGHKYWVDYANMSLVELEELADSYGNSATEQLERERQAEEEAILEFESRIQDVINLGAGDRQTALRWITSQETFYHQQCVEHFVWELGVLFTSYGKDLIKELLGVVEYKEMV